MSLRRRFQLVCAVVPAFVGVVCVGVDLEVVAVQPARHAGDGLIGSPIVVDFDQAVLPASVDKDSFWAFGRWSGTATGTYAFSNGNKTVTLIPNDPFFPGETVMVILSHDIESASGDNLRGGGYSWQFWTVARPASRTFTTLDTLTTRTIAN